MEWVPSLMQVSTIALVVPCVAAAGMDSRGGIVALRGAQTHLASTDAELSWSPCKTCEWGVRSVQDFVADPKHQLQLAEAVETVTCTFMPHDEKSQCHKRIEAGIRQVVQFFEDKVSPAEVCQPLCSANEELYISPKAVSTPYPLCAYCNFAATQLPEVAGQGDDVNKVLLNVCSSLPPAFSEPCREFIREHGHDVAEASQEAPGTSACVATGLCANPVIEAMAEEDLPETLHSVLADGFSKIGSMQLREMCSADTGVSDWEDQECEFCKISVREARQKLADPMFQAEIEKYLKKLCTRAGDFEDMCKQYIMQYAPIAFALAQQYLVPSKVCTYLRMCPYVPPPPMGA